MILRFPTMVVKWRAYSQIAVTATPPNGFSIRAADYAAGESDYKTVRHKLCYERKFPKPEDRERMIRATLRRAGGVS